MSTTRHGAGREASPIAIVGMGCMFPNARNLKEFWRTLRRGEDGIREVPPSHWSAEDYFDPDPRRPDMTYCARGGFLSPVAFDPTEFGIPPAILEATDTSQLLGLVAAKAALEDAGYGDDRAFDRDRVSVILGVTGTQELVLPLTARLGHPHWRRALRDAGVDQATAEDVVRRISERYVGWQENSFPGLLGNVIAGRIANRLDLRGTNCVVDAACASSLSAVHLAMLELAEGRCDMALAGGVDTLNDIFMYMCFSKTPALSATGDARPFSSDADGTVLGEGVGVLILKRLADAERDGDRVYAVIKAIGTSSDGRSQSIYAPHAGGQARALRDAYELAGITCDSVELLEAHGTGTKVGDVTEFEALRTVFAETQGRGRWCALGSVKSQIGHTKAAAGVAGLIKAALAIHHRALPPSIKIKSPSPKLGIDSSPFYLSTELRPWLPRKGAVRRAGVSAFGFGGSNFHAVLEEHPSPMPAVAWDGSAQIIAISADSVEGLRSSVDEWLALCGDEHFSPELLAYSAAESRGRFRVEQPHRLLLVSTGQAELRSALSDVRSKLASSTQPARWALPNAFYGSAEPEGKLAFLFPGQGSQYIGMGRDLACLFPEMLLTFAEADEAGDLDGCRLLDLVCPTPTFDEDEKAGNVLRLQRTDFSQPALGAVSLGMSRVLQRFGVRPGLAAGHSYGELVALCAADRFDSVTLHHLSRLRGRLMAESGDEQGAMLAVKASYDDLLRLLDEEKLDLAVANRNAPTQVVLSGDRSEIVRAAEACRAHGLATTLLNVSRAFHSKSMEGALPPFRNALQSIDFRAGSVTVFANCTGLPYPEDAAEARRLLAEQLVSPVDFVSEIENLYESGARTFVEVGPRAVLTRLVGEILADREHSAWAMDVSAGRRSAIVDLARLLAQIAARGHEIDLSQWEPDAAEPRTLRMVVPLVGANYRRGSASANESRKLSADTGGLPADETPRSTDAALHSESSGTTASSDSAFANAGGRLEEPRGGSSDSDRDESMRLERTPLERPEPTQSSRSLGHDAREPGSGDDPTAAIPFVDGAPKADVVRVERGAGDAQTGPLGDALKLLQEGLRGMQALQEQTAEAHQRFLEGQEQAHRTFQTLLEGQQRLAESALGSEERAARVPPEPLPPVDLPKAPASEPEPRTVTAVSEKAASDEPASEHALDAAEPVYAPPAAAISSPEEDSEETWLGVSEIESMVLKVVSEKTGYPVEMIDLDMDIEADLGVDSIKRVEIIAALEERIESFDGVKPEYMGAIRSLRQVVDFVVSGGPAVSSVADGSQPSGEAAAADRKTAEPATTGSASEFASSLLDIVAERTGYPTDMLELDMDLEADLGIDSIKRVEILAAIEERMPDLPPVKPEYMGSLQTLRQIVEYCAGGSAAEPPRDRASGDGVQPLPAAPVPDVAHSQEAVDHAEGASGFDINRRVLRAVPLRDGVASGLPVAADREILVTDDGGGLSAEIVAQLKFAGYSARVIQPREIGALGQAAVGGLVFVAPALGVDRETLWIRQTEELLETAFLVMKAVAPRLREAVSRGGALCATVSRMDGMFGLSGGEFDAAQGGLAGLAKTAAREWEGVDCRALDLALSCQDLKAAAAAVVTELQCDGPIEVGLDGQMRRGLELVSAGLVDGQPAIASGDVVVITGGARGVTAEAAVALADRYRPTLVLIGRTDLPAQEPEWLAGLEAEGDIKEAIRIHEFGHVDRPAPKDIERAFSRYLACREIRANLDRMAAAGATVSYRSVDIREPQAVRRVIDEVRDVHGPVRGLVHGAGVIHDRLIEDKTLEQFSAVLDTKVGGLSSLLGALTPEDLKHVVLFSSASGRCGNRGQADYAAANEVLNKAAHRLATRLPACRVVSMNWGPWDGGMVNEALRREYQRLGVQLIPPAVGGKCVADELANAAEGSIEIVLGADFEMPRRRPVRDAAETAPSKMTTAIRRRIDLQTHPFLASHVLDGRPVLPVAMMVEWLAHAALHANPGLQFQGIDDLRVLKGVVLSEEGERLRFDVAAPRRSGHVFDVDIELKSERDDGTEVLHARASVVLSSRPTSSPVPQPPIDRIAEPYGKSVAEAYSDILFHGEHFQGLQRIEGCSSIGIAAAVRSAPPTADWMAEPMRSDWLADPLVLDCALQMTILWSAAEMGAVSLPVYFRSYRQYCTAFPDEEIAVTFLVRRRERHKVVGDLFFASRDGTLLARLEGCESTVDASLSEAFRRRVCAKAKT